MLATALAPERARAVIGEYSGELAVAVYNAAQATVISGRSGALAEVQARLDAEGAWSRLVADGVPAHSPMLDPLLPRLTAALQGLHPGPARIPIVSTRTATTLTGSEMDAAYWIRQLREPVLLRRAVTRIAEQEPRVFLEVAPRGVLRPHLSETLAATTGHSAVVGAPRHDDERGEYAALTAQAAELFIHGPVPTLTPQHPVSGVALPTVWDRGVDTVPGSTSVPLATRLDLASSSAERTAIIETWLRDLLAEILALDPEQVPTDREIDTLGISLIDLFEVRAGLRGAHPGLQDFALSALAEAPTISELSRTVEARLQRSQEDGAIQRHNMR